MHHGQNGSFRGPASPHFCGQHHHAGPTPRFPTIPGKSAPFFVPIPVQRRPRKVLLQTGAPLTKVSPDFPAVPNNENCKLQPLQTCAAATSKGQNTCFRACCSMVAERVMLAATSAGAQCQRKGQMQLSAHKITDGRFLNVLPAKCFQIFVTCFFVSPPETHVYPF